MHDPTPQDAVAAREMLEWALARLAERRETLPPSVPAPALPELTERGLGSVSALRQLRDVVFPTAIPTDHPRYLGFIPGAPSVTAVIADMALSASGIYGGSRLEAGAAVTAEDAVLRWLADAAGFPSSAGGTFVSGGSIANLSALVAARADEREQRRHVIVVGASAHSSLAAAARVMGCDLTTADAADGHGRLDEGSLTAAIAGLDPREIVAVVATAGATNNGAVDDIAGIAAVCGRKGLWLHVDAAYGGAALLSPRARDQFAGIERADSLTIDPHKWLFTPFDCAAVLYRDEAAALRAMTQHADYLDALDDEAGGVDPSDLAIHLTRRARGLPLWVSLLAYGTAAYVAAVDACLELARHAADRIAAAPHLELAIEPALSVVLFHRLGWSASDYAAWSKAAIASGLALAVPTKHAGRPAMRFCFVNPLTTVEDIDLVLASLA